MYVKLSQELAGSERGKSMEKQLRACVHCGFCTATCPTYKLTGDDNDSPRGRIYLMRELVEQGPSNAISHHLDRCLNCRACETACPSGVAYGELIGHAREQLEQSNSTTSPILKLMLRELFTRRHPITGIIGTARIIRPLLPNKLKNMIPKRHDPGAWPRMPEKPIKKVLLFPGCIQKVAQPLTHNAAARVFAKNNISTTTLKGRCCGAIHHHFGDSDKARQIAQDNVTAWTPLLQDANAIASTATGCSAMLREYHKLLPDNKDAQKISQAVQDPAEIIKDCNIQASTTAKNIAWHSPCSMRHPHNQQQASLPTQILQQAGHNILPEPAQFQCCGSAGMYSILHPKLAAQLRNQRLQQLQQQSPDIIATANIGCQLHMQQATATPIRHWIEILDAANNN